MQGKELHIVISPKEFFESIRNLHFTFSYCCESFAFKYILFSQLVVLWFNNPVNNFSHVGTEPPFPGYLTYGERNVHRAPLVRSLRKLAPAIYKDFIQL